MFTAAANKAGLHAYAFFGGCADTERNMAGIFGDMADGGYSGRPLAQYAIDDDAIAQGDGAEDGATSDFPISALHIAPKSKQFAQTLEHRDYLGSILGLGIDRSKVGDIFLCGSDAYVFCSDAIAPFIASNLQQVRHTNVNTTLLENPAQAAEVISRMAELHREGVSGSVASVRLDALVHLAFGISRTQAQEEIRARHAFVNGRETTGTDYVPKPGDIISVRGTGKFRYIEQTGTTKKGKIGVRLERYA
jgi:RNA-binding protein YlmH